MLATTLAINRSMTHLFYMDVHSKNNNNQKVYLKSANLRHAAICNFVESRILFSCQNYFCRAPSYYNWKIFSTAVSTLNFDLDP